MKIPKRSDVTNPWFITEAPQYLKFLQIYILGDALVILPFTVAVLILALFSWKWAVLLYGIFLVFRYLGEMVYWMFQQFGEKQYRPPDGGFTHIGSPELYVLYQLKALVWAVLSAGAVVWVLVNVLQ